MGKMTRKDKDVCTRDEEWRNKKVETMDGERRKQIESGNKGKKERKG